MFRTKCFPKTRKRNIALRDRLYNILSQDRHDSFIKDLSNETPNSISNESINKHTQLEDFLL